MRPIVPPPIVGLAAAGVIWLAFTYLPALTIAFPGQIVLAAIFAGTGVLIEGMGVLAFLRKRTTINPLRPERAGSLVVSGLYRISRNPMYLGMAVLLAGWALYLGSLAALIIIPAFVWLLTELQIKPEEVALESVFGEDYQSYKARVRRWI
ncbi:methyltransferase family protein [Roseibium aggregatum]|uniref:Isoprenylcysteine carboxylmethyltransferase family protein n=1 Tax=Roseibium aggregatum TaxID=187304 RepID=A0A926P2F2_9HYPH|nr:isoprenylcysteine carboxylmethyltransferase family protein [Roseibium aggregatum]MBD1548313.1 isoprenylcysteine carboxylmethyltransferase family protein [Roseibium aggregatum]